MIKKIFPGKKRSGSREQRQQKRHWKYNFTFPELLRNYSNSFNLYNVAELSRNRIVRKGVQVKTENKNAPSCANVLHKTLNLIISRRTAKKWTKIYNARAGPLFFALNSIVFDILIAVAVVAAFNPLSLNSDQHQISPCNINAYATPQVKRIKYMVTQGGFSGYFNNFSPVLLEEK